MQSLLWVGLLSGLLANAGPRFSVPHTAFTLDNGLTVIVHEDHSVPRVHVAMRYGVGSSRETPGRTGFAHLFEHLMFEGSAHVPEGAFDQWLEQAGGENNAYTSEDETYYFSELPTNALDLALFLESDRQGFFLEGIDANLVDGQRDVVKNERRQSYENQPYGNAELLLPPALWPKGHPYSWDAIGSMSDLSAASIDDVKQFFSRWYAPGNAILVIVGDVETEQVKRRVKHWFSDVPDRGRPTRPTEMMAPLRGEQRIVTEDPLAPLPKLVIAWPSVPVFHQDDAALDVAAEALGGPASARLKRRLVHELQIAQDVSVAQRSMERAGVFEIEAVAMPGIPLPRLLAAIDEELARLARDGPTDAELLRTHAKVETALADSLDGLADKAARLASYQAYWQQPDGFQRDLVRYHQLTAAQVRASVNTHLSRGRVVMSVVPLGGVGLAVINRSAP
jgi:zinc protease